MDKFITPVNSAGLPPLYEVPTCDGQNQLKGLDRIKLCTLYWKVKTIEVNYTYQITNQYFKRNYSLEFNENMEDRLYTPPYSSHFEEIPYNEYNKIICQASIPLGSAAQIPQKDNQYSLEVNLNENEIGWDWQLTTGDPMPNAGLTRISSIEADCLGTPLPLHLYTKGNLPGKILNFNISLKLNAYYSKKPPQ